jgi:hypothetical protein
MIKFFRKIRQELLLKGKTGKYFTYAIGEIVLVVIGILIALQINDWNQNKKDTNETFAIRNNLIEEFKNNRTVLKERIALVEKSLDYSEQMLTFLGKPREYIQRHNLDSIFVNTLYYGNFNPPNSTISEILQSGKLKLIKDQNLKSLLDQWLQMLEDTDEDFKNQDVQANEYFLPYINDNISMRNIDLYGSIRVSNSKSELIEDYFYNVLHDYKFENLLITHMDWNFIMVNHYKDLNDLALNIIDHISSFRNSYD